RFDFARQTGPAASLYAQFIDQFRICLNKQQILRTCLFVNHIFILKSFSDRGGLEWKSSVRTVWRNLEESKNPKGSKRQRIKGGSVVASIFPLTLWPFDPLGFPIHRDRDRFSSRKAMQRSGTSDVAASPFG